MADWYEIVVGQHLDVCWQDWFGGITLVNREDGLAVLCGQFDQAALFGVIEKVRNLNLTLISVQKIRFTDIPGKGYNES